MRGPDFLLALDENGHTNRRPPLPRLQRRRVNRDPGLVIGRTAAKKASLAFSRLEWRRLPELGGPGRLNVMMGVQQNRRRPGRSCDGAEHGRMRGVDLEQPDVVEPRTLQPRCGRFRCPPYLITCGFVSANRRYAHEVVKFSADPLEGRLHPCPDGLRR